MAEMIAKSIKQLCRLRNLFLLEGRDRTINIKWVPDEEDGLIIATDAKFVNLSLELSDVLWENESLS